MLMKKIIRKHPLIAYFSLAFVISWSAALLAILPILVQRRPLSQTDGLLMFPPLLLGPACSGLLLTYMEHGRRGVQALFQKVGVWRVGLRWYGTLFIPPLFVFAVLIVSSRLISPVFRPHLSPLGLAYGILPGFVEELGWSGYAFPKMQQLIRKSVVPSSVILGIIWGLWHLPVVDFLGAAFPHKTYLPLFALGFIFIMTGIRVIISWVYSHTQSLLLPQLLHAVSTASLAVLAPVSISPGRETLWYWLYGSILWCVIVIWRLLHTKNSPA